MSIFNYFCNNSASARTEHHSLAEALEKRRCLVKKRLYAAFEPSTAAIFRGAQACLQRDDALSGRRRNCYPFSSFFSAFSARFAIRRRMITSTVTETTTKISASSWETGIVVPARKSWSVRMPSIQNLPSP